MFCWFEKMKKINIHYMHSYLYIEYLDLQKVLYKRERWPGSIFPEIIRWNLLLPFFRVPLTISAWTVSVNHLWQPAYTDIRVRVRISTNAQAHCRRAPDTARYWLIPLHVDKRVPGCVNNTYIYICRYHRYAPQNCASIIMLPPVKHVYWFCAKATRL